VREDTAERLKDLLERLTRSSFERNDDDDEDEENEFEAA
jgi:hypothetical protein